MRKHLFLRTAIIIVFFAGFSLSCGGNGAYSEGRSFPSISSVSGLWLEIKRELVSTKLNAVDLVSQLDFFHVTLNRFSDSPVGVLYRMNRPEGTGSLINIDSAIDRLKIAVQQGDVPEILSISLEIDSDLEMLLLIDKNLSDTSQLHYFQLFFFFTLLVIIIILTLGILYRRLEKVENREQQSLAFSRETVMAQEQERSRIARELHDTVAQDLWRLSFQTDSIDKAQDSAERSRLCGEVTSGQKELMRRIRNICDNLIPPDFLRRSLDDALRSLCYNFAQRTGIECQVAIQEGLLSGALSSDMQLQCYRITQECLANIEKHAKATEVSVLARRGSIRDNTQGELIICVSDNGKGFSPPNRDSSHLLRAQRHFGLWNMYERAASLNSVLTIDSEFGEGTVVTLRVLSTAISAEFHGGGNICFL